MVKTSGRVSHHGKGIMQQNQSHDLFAHQDYLEIQDQFLLF